MADEYMKVTHHTQQGTKWNVYISLIQSFEALKVEIEGYLSGDADKRHNFRMYWIDEQADEIDIVKAADYSVFLERNKNLRHLHVVSVNVQNVEPKKPDENTSNSTLKNLFPTTAPHPLVECDNCKMKPIVGFRYKCIECNNFDLCQRCEAMHCHPEHMMVRMPNSKCRNVIETWMAGRSSRRSHKRANRNQCPFMPSTSDDVPSAAPGGGDTERSHHSRRSHRHRDLNSGLFGHLYTMMQDLAEGGVDHGNESVVNVAAAAAAKAAEDAATAAAATAKTAKTAAAAAAKASEAFQAAASQTESEMSMSYKEQIQPTTPPTTPNDAGVPPMSAPSFENLAQVLDPEYMRAGLKILNNFSEMFAKMLDPNDGVGMSCPFAGEAPCADRKNSSTSTSTSTENSEIKSTKVDIENSNTAAATAGKGSDEQAKKSESEIPSSSISTPPTSIGIADNESQTPKENSRRSQSIEDNEWQLIDKATTSMANETEAVTSTTVKSVGQNIDYEQLSKELKIHIEEENKREKLSKEMQTPPAASAPIPIATEASTSAETPQTRNDEKRAVLYFHPDPRVNNSVNAMMAMGFSNEGGWLTELLSTVNGNIPEALDLLSAAQRNK